MVFPGGAAALNGVSVDVGAADFLVVLGPSGAGKSTLLRVLNRLGEVTSGRVIFRGDDVTRVVGSRLRLLRQNVGMIFQQFNLVGRITVLENVLAGRLRFTRGLPYLLSHVRLFPKAEREFALASLERVGVAHLAHRRADTLSGGQQQRVAIARVLAQQPSVILADEPIASLDPRSAQVVMDILRDIHERQGLPVVVNLHQVDFAQRYATRIVGMRAGKVVFSGPPGDLSELAARGLYQQQGDRPDPADTPSGPLSGPPSGPPAASTNSPTVPAAAPAEPLALSGAGRPA